MGGKSQKEARPQGQAGRGLDLYPVPVGAALRFPRHSPPFPPTMPALSHANTHIHTRPFSSGPPGGEGPSGGHAFAQPLTLDPALSPRLGAKGPSGLVAVWGLGSQSKGASLVTFPQGPDTLMRPLRLPWTPGWGPDGSGWGPPPTLRLGSSPAAK